MALRVPINLATQPFRRDRPVIAGAVALSAALVAVLVFQSWLIKSERDEAAGTRVMLSRIEKQDTALQRDNARLAGVLRRPENADVLDRSVFLNGLIARKAISWTRLFADLDKVMPHDVRLVSVRLPQVDAQNRVWLDMTVASKDLPPLLQFLRNLEGSPQFGPTNVMTSLPPTQTEQFVRYRVSVSYAQKL